ncbi:MAG: acyl-CoA thioesterase, partial [Anaerolineales bacterium]
DLVTLNAELTYVGRSSIEVRLEVTAQNLLTGERTHTNTAYFVYVALDEMGRPAGVPPLLFETDAERRQGETARERQAYRLAQRASQTQKD